MISRLLSKKTVQSMIAALRKAKLTVTKDSNGAYTVSTIDGRKVFIALPGRNAYLVRLEADLFGEVAVTSDVLKEV